MQIERVKEMIAYEAESGAFTWLCNRKGRWARVGAPAGGARPDGYVRIGIDGKSEYAHRLAWQMAVGPIPKGMEIDHIDHDPSNNRLSNLRLVTSSGNRRNRSRDSRNTSGVNGVYWAPHANAWCVQLRVDRKVHHIGYFKDLDEAALVRKRVEAEHKFHQNHGASNAQNS